MLNRARCDILIRGDGENTLHLLKSWLQICIERNTGMGIKVIAPSLFVLFGSAGGPLLSMWLQREKPCGGAIIAPPDSPSLSPMDPTHGKGNHCLGAEIYGCHFFRFQHFDLLSMPKLNACPSRKPTGQLELLPRGICGPTFVI